MHSSTALASSGLMLRMLSSAFGDFFVKLSQASYRMAEGDVEPGLNIDSVEAKENAQKMNPRKPTRNGTENRRHTRNLLYQVTNVFAKYADAIHFSNRNG